MVLRLRFDDFERVTRSHTIAAPTAETEIVLAAARELLTDAMALIDERGVTLVGLAMANLDDDDAVQLTLPFDRHAGGALDAALDGVRERFGSGRASPAPSCSAVTRRPPCHSARPTGTRFRTVTDEDRLYRAIKAVATPLYRGLLRVRVEGLDRIPSPAGRSSPPTTSRSSTPSPCCSRSPGGRSSSARPSTCSRGRHAGCSRRWG